MAQSSQEEKQGKFLVLPLIVLIMAQMGTSGDNGALSIATSQLLEGFNASMSEIQLANTMYCLVAGAAMTAAGMVGTIIGWKKNFRMGALLAAVGEVVMAVSPNMLIFTWVGRFLVGFGGSFLIPSMLGLVPKIYTTNKDRALAFGGIGAATGLSTFLPLIFGALLQLVGFRITFGILACYFILVFAASFVFPEVEEEEHKLKLDTVGIILAAIGLFCFIIGMSNISVWGLTTAFATSSVSIAGFSPAVPLTLFGLVVLAFLLHVEKGVEAKNGCCLIPRSFVATPQVVAGLIASFITFYYMGIQIIILIPYLQVVAGIDAITTGLLNVIYGIPMFLVSLFLPKVVKNPNPKVILNIGYVLMALGLLPLAMALIPGDVRIPMIVVSNIIAGTGTGFVASQASTVVALVLNPRDAAQSGGVQATMRNVGQATATALLGTVLLFSISSGVTNNMMQDESFSPEVIQAVQDKNISLSSDEDMFVLADELGMSDQEAEKFVSVYSDARVKSSRVALAVGAAFVLVSTLSTRWINSEQK